MLSIECKECHEIIAVTQTTITWPFTCDACKKDAELLSAMAPSSLSSLNRTASGASRISRSLNSTPWKFAGETASEVALPSERVASRFAEKTASEAAGLPYTQTASVDATTDIINDLLNRVTAERKSVLFLEAREKALSENLDSLRAQAQDVVNDANKVAADAVETVKENIALKDEVASQGKRLSRKAETLLKCLEAETDLRSRLYKSQQGHLAALAEVNFWKKAAFKSRSRARDYYLRYLDEMTKTWWTRLWE